MKAIKEASKFIISLLIMFCLVAMTFSVFTRTTLLNASFYKNNLKKSDYFTLLRNEIDYGFKNYSMITSIPEGVFTEVLGNEDIIRLTNDNIDNSMDYLKFKKDYIDEKIKDESLKKSIKTYISSYAKGSELDSQGQVVLNEAANIVNKHAVLFDLTQVIKYKEFQSFRKGLYLVYDLSFALFIVFLILAVLLFLLNCGNVRGFFLWLGGAIIPASLFILIPAILALIYKIPYRYSVGNSYLKAALRDFTLGYIKYFSVSGVILLLGGIAILACLAKGLTRKAEK